MLSQKQQAFLLVTSATGNPEKQNHLRKQFKKIADYFDVSVDYLLGREPSSETKKDGSAEALPPDTPLTLYQKQLIEFAESLTEEEVKKVLSYIRFVLSERDGK